MRLRRSCPRVLLVGLLTASAPTAWAAQQRPELCHIANAGFALHGPEGTVLIDALFRDGLPDYQHASDGLNRLMETGAHPFADVRLVIASHAHADHFNAGAFVSHAKNNPETHYIVTPQARKKMLAAGFSSSDLDRVRASHPDNDEKEILQYADTIVTVFRVSHGKESSVQNIGVLIEWEGIRMFHTGDMEPYADELAAADLENLDVDVAMVPFWVLMSEDNRRLVRKVFAAKTIIPMHMPEQEQTWMAEYGGLAGLRRLISSNMPNAVWMTGELACRPIGGTAGRIE